MDSKEPAWLLLSYHTSLSYFDYANEENYIPVAEPSIVLKVTDRSLWRIPLTVSIKLMLAPSSTVNDD